MTNPQTTENAKPQEMGQGGVDVTPHEREKCRQSITINASPEKVFGFYRDFKNLPLFMKELQDIEVLSPQLSRWRVKLSSGPEVKWDAEIIAEIPNQMISWRSVGESEVSQRGTIWFDRAPAGRGTIIHCAMDFSVPGGMVTEFVTKMMGEDPNTLVNANLKRLKAYVETGEIPTVEGQPSGREETSYYITNKYTH